MICFWTKPGSFSHTAFLSYSEVSKKVPPSSRFLSMSYFSRNEKLWQAIKLALVMKYGLRMRFLPKRKCDTVTAPAFLES